LPSADALPILCVGPYSRKRKVSSVARCYVCGAATQLYENGEPVCLSCCGELQTTPKPPQSAGALENLNARLNAARQEYLQAVVAQREAAELRRSLSTNNLTEAEPLHNANRQVSLASGKYEQALQEFIVATSVRRRSD
jgi:hypothetical protein